MSKITPEVIEKVAKLSRLSFSKEEMEKFADQLNDVLQYSEKLNELDLKDVEPTARPHDTTNVFREDTPNPSLSPEDALSNAPAEEDNCFKVPKIIQQT